MDYLHLEKSKYINKLINEKWSTHLKLTLCICIYILYSGNKVGIDYKGNA